MVQAMAEDKKTAGDLVPVEQVARMLGKSPFTVVRHLKDGSLPGGWQPWKRGPWYMTKNAYDELLAQIASVGNKTGM